MAKFEEGDEVVARDGGRILRGTVDVITDIYPKIGVDCGDGAHAFEPEDVIHADVYDAVHGADDEGPLERHMRQRAADTTIKATDDNLASVFDPYHREERVAEAFERIVEGSRQAAESLAENMHIKCGPLIAVSPEMHTAWLLEDLVDLQIYPRTFCVDADGVPMGQGERGRLVGCCGIAYAEEEHVKAIVQDLLWSFDDDKPGLRHCPRLDFTAVQEPGGELLVKFDAIGEGGIRVDEGSVTILKNGDRLKWIMRALRLRTDAINAEIAKKQLGMVSDETYSKLSTHVVDILVKTGDARTEARLQLRDEHGVDVTVWRVDVDTRVMVKMREMSVLIEPDPEASIQDIHALVLEQCCEMVGKWAVYDEKDRKNYMRRVLAAA